MYLLSCISIFHTSWDKRFLCCSKWKFMMRGIFSPFVFCFGVPNAYWPLPVISSIISRVWTSQSSWRIFIIETIIRFILQCSSFWHRLKHSRKKAMVRNQTKWGRWVILCHNFRKWNVWKRFLGYQRKYYVAAYCRKHFIVKITSFDYRHFEPLQVL